MSDYEAPVNGQRKLQFEVDAEVFDRLVAAGPRLNGQRPNQIAALLVNVQNIERLEQRWVQMFGGHQS